MSPLRWGVLGAGRVATGYVLPSIAASSEGMLYAVGSRSIDRARAVAATHDAVRSYEGYDAVLADPNVDAVYISLPNSMHAEWTIRALDFGKAVLCEKPIVASADEADRVLDATRASDQLVSEAFMYRHHPQFRWLIEAARIGRFGEPGFVHASIGAIPETTDEIRWSRALGGGALNDLGCYAIDLACAVFDAPADSATATSEFDRLSEVDVGVAAALRFGTRFATVETSFRMPWISTPVEVWFSSARCRFNHFFNPGRHSTTAVVERPGATPMMEQFAGHDAYLAMIEVFEERWQSGEADTTWYATAQSAHRVRLALSQPSALVQ